MFLQNPPPIRIGGILTQEPVPVHALQDSDTDELYAGRRTSRRRCARCPGFIDVTSDLQITSPQIVLDIDRDKAARARRHRRPDRERALQRLRLAAGLDHLHADQPVLGDLEVLPEFQRDPAALSLLYVRSVHGQARAARSRWRRSSPRSARSSVNHLGQLPAVTISFNLRAGRLARRGHAKHRTSAWPNCDVPADAHHELPGHGAGVPVVARRAWASC